MLWRSRGQLTVFFFQSMKKFATSKPSVGFGLLLVLSLKAGPMRSIFWWTWLKTRLLPQT